RPTPGVQPVSSWPVVAVRPWRTSRTVVTLTNCTACLPAGGRPPSTPRSWGAATPPMPPCGEGGAGTTPPSHCGRGYGLVVAVAGRPETGHPVRAEVRAWWLLWQAAPRPRRLLVAAGEDYLEVAEAHQVAGVYGDLAAGPPSVHPGAVGGLQVAQQPAVRRPLELGVQPRHRHVGDRQVAARVPADAELVAATGRELQQERPPALGRAAHAGGQGADGLAGRGHGPRPGAVRLASRAAARGGRGRAGDPGPGAAQPAGQRAPAAGQGGAGGGGEVSDQRRQFRLAAGLEHHVDPVQERVVRKTARDVLVPELGYHLIPVSVRGAEAGDGLL